MAGGGEEVEAQDGVVPGDAPTRRGGFAVAWDQRIWTVQESVDAALAFVADRFASGRLPPGAPVVITDLGDPTPHGAVPFAKKDGLR